MTLTDLEEPSARQGRLSGEGFDARLPLIAITILAAGLRLWELGRESLWRDEGTAYFVSTLPWSDLWQVLIFERANMVFYFALLRLWSLIVSGEFALRLLSAIPGILSIPLIYWLGARLFGKATGLYAALVLALSALHIGYSRELRGYSLMVALLILSAILLDRALDSNRRPDWFGHVVTAVLSFYCSTTAVLLLIPLWLTIPLFHRVRLRTIAYVVICYSLATSPLILVSTRSDLSIIGAGVPFEPWRLARIVTSFTSGRSLLLFFGLLGIVVIASMLRTSVHRRSLVGVTIWLLVPFFAILLLWPVLPPTSRYVICALIPLSILSGFGMARVPWAWLRTLIVLSFVLLSAREITPGSRKPDWRSATNYLLQHLDDRDGVAIFATQGTHPFLYYAGDQAERVQFILPEDPIWWTREMPPDPDQVAIRAEKFSRVWLILCALSNQGRQGDKERLDQALRLRFRRVNDVDFYRVSIVLYEHR